jgi:hypothetical protein
MMLAAVGAFDNLRRLLIFSVIFVGVAFFASQQLPSIEAEGVTFISKVGNSLLELAFNDGSNHREMLTNWRGFEAYRAFVGFSESTLLQQLVGRGFGATVDLGLAIQMSENMNFEFVPHIHNGYMYLLTKNGLIGLLLYLLFLCRISGQSLSASNVPEQIAMRRILIGMSLVLVYTTLVITGIFNKSNHDPILIMLGVFLRVAYIWGQPITLQVKQVSSQTQL